MGQPHQQTVKEYQQSDIFAVDSIQKNETFLDSLFELSDTLNNIGLDATTRTDSGILVINYSEDTLEAKVVYSASDSIVFDIEEKKVLLYGNAKANYQVIDLTSDFIEYNWTNNTLTAELRKDKKGNPIGYAVFTESGKEYKAKRISYNFKTGKGKVFHVMTQEGEGYMHSEAVKKNEYDEWYAYRGKYTTCNLEHPHYYFQAKKMKLVPDKIMATGPANMVVSDVPTPLYIPFGLFPVKQGQRSGLVIGEWGEESQRGFFLRNWGYYFGISDFVDLSITADFYSRGSWALRSASSYKKRYKFGGNIHAEYGRNRSGEPESPTATRSNDFRFVWKHDQDPKARPNTRFNANVSFGSTSYDRNFSQDRDRILNNSLASKITYSKSWAGRPLSFSLNFAHDQNLNTGRINLSLPILAFGVSRIQPFKSKKISTKPKWYENIGFSYRLDAKNVLSGIDSTFLQKETLRNAKYGIQHSIPISSSFRVMKYFTLSPRLNYTERWYFQTINKTWNPDPIYVFTGDSIVDTIFGSIVVDTAQAFKAARDFSFSISLATKLFGQINFKGKKIKAIRHVFTPSLNFTATPDFTKDFWGYYKSVQSNAAGDFQTYSVFDNVQGIYGRPPPNGLVSSVGLNLNNLLEMKVFSKKDTVKNERKIKLLESFNIGGSYNLAADSLNLSVININGRTSLYKNLIKLDFRTVLDPYVANDNNRRINTFIWEQDRRLTRMTSTDFALTANIQSNKATQPHSSNATQEELDMLRNNRDQYYDFNIPWSFVFRYNFGFTKGQPGNPEALNISNNSVDFTFDANITRNWKFNIRTGYDFDEMDFVFTQMSIIRNLHCWELKFDWAVYPIQNQFYNIQVNVKSSMLQDLKLSKRKNPFDNVF